MKKIIYSLLVFTSATMLAQKNTNVNFTIYNDVVGTDEMFAHYKEKIESKHFFKPKEKLPQHLEKFAYIAEKGLTEIKLKKNIGTPDIIPLEILNEQYRIPKDTPIFIEGYEFDDTTIRIYSEIITKVDVKDDSDKKYLYIFTTDK
ncbi:hypothetical protein [Chryseobacterium sp. ERMR1:04]|uniref:hypothetical protein n=1 Tax=Chryseobacterium sp. ERMR1:04 TaxID=1705393 RepID=UPI0006CD7DC7|nr:hypothetical protein [Chryseobacterium sp. ERMR1:04]KPH14792.1 hypothetical protein AMQ68_04965 [Chryseobacterium sp. ERMR1:04]